MLSFANFSFCLMFPFFVSVYFPTEADVYPVIFFVGGLNGYIWAEWYDLYLEMLAAHGFIVVGVDYQFPLYPKQAKMFEEKFSQDISKFFDEIDFVSDALYTQKYVL